MKTKLFHKGHDVPVEWRNAVSKANKGKRRAKNTEFKKGMEPWNKKYNTIKERTHSYYEANKEKLIERSKKYREANKDKVSECRKRYYRKNKEAISIMNRKEFSRTNDQSKKICLTHYSRGELPECCHDGCGITDIDVLTLDHVNDDGAEHRKSLPGNGRGLRLYRWIIKNEFPAGFQVLCWNHNVKKQCEKRRRDKAEKERCAA